MFVWMCPLSGRGAERAHDSSSSGDSYSRRTARAAFNDKSCKITALETPGKTETRSLKEGVGWQGGLPVRHSQSMRWVDILAFTAGSLAPKMCLSTFH